MSNEIKISVIMPSLNVGDYIEECILSVINQTLKDIEIICIDAGSTDNTLNILKEYAEKDERITLLHSDKKSYGHQVNMGLKQSKGEYISIVETDDFIDENMLNSLYELSDNGKVDIIKGTFYHYNDYDKHNIIANIDNFKEDLPNSKKFTLKENSLFIEGHPSVWAGIYKKSFLDSANIKMVEAPAGGWVDNPFFFETAIAAKSIVYTHEPFYYYRVSNPNSSSNKFNDFTMPMDRVLDMFNILEKHNFYDENVIERFYNRLFRYIEIILENNDNSDKNLDYETCLRIHEVVEKVDEKIVIEKMKFNFQKIYYKYISPLFLARFKKPSKLSNGDFELLFKENEFLHDNVTYFRTKFNETNYEKRQLEKKYKNASKLLGVKEISLTQKKENRKKLDTTKTNESRLSQIKNKPLKQISYETHEENEYPISIIMPVFNGAKFLERSMKSLLRQTLENFEIVFINDGSTDNSLEILKDYEKKYDFVTVLSQENSGSGKARNYGINEAKGEYIGFLDADDFFMDEDALEKMYELGKLNNADMVTANIKHDVENEGKFVPFGPFKYYTSNDIILPEQYGIPWSFYKNIFKREFLVKNEIYFPDLLRGQDPVFLAEALTKVDKIYVAATDLYAYVYNSDTAKANNPRKLYDQLLHYRQVIDYLNIPKFSRRRNEYFEKIILFCSRLDDNSVEDAIVSIRDIFKDMPEFLNRLENYIYLKFKHLEEVKELIPKTKISVIMEVQNSEKFFEKTVNSLINQTMDDFELILINKFNDDTFEYIKPQIENESWIKIIEPKTNDEDILRDTILNEVNGDYIYFCEDNYIFENNLFEELFETSLTSDSDICLCNLPAGGVNNNRELNFKNIMGNHYFKFYSSNNEKLIPYVFSSSFDMGYSFYKKSFLHKVLSDEKLLNDKSVLQIKALLNSSKISYVPEFLFKYLNKNNIFYSSQNPVGNDISLNVFDVCDEVESFLKEKSVYDDLKTYFDIYKINKICSYLDSVRFVGCYSYNDPKNRDLYANNDKVLDYSQYYGSKSEHVGLDYGYANQYFSKTKDEFNKLNYRDLRFLDLNSNHFSNSENMKKYNSVLKSNSYEEYMKIDNFSRIEEIRRWNKDLKAVIEGRTSRKSKKKEENNNQLTNLQKEINTLKKENKSLTEKQNNLRDDYWENRNEYDYIVSSRSWKYTKWMRK